MPDAFPALRAVAVDATDARAVAEFYRELLGYVYRSGDEPPPLGEPDPKGEDWLVLRDRTGEARLAVQHVGELPRATWPDPGIPQQLHLDMTVADEAQLAEQRDRALVPRRVGPHGSIDRSRRGALRVRRPGRPSLLHLRVARPSRLRRAPRSEPIAPFAAHRAQTSGGPAAAGRETVSRSRRWRLTGLRPSTSSAAAARSTAAPWPAGGRRRRGGRLPRRSASGPAPR